MIKKVGLLILTLFSCNSYAINYEITPQSIQSQATTHTWGVVLNELFTNQTAANMVLLAIDSGKDDWLELALVMLQQSKNERTQKMLLMSLGEALQWQPQRVLNKTHKQIPVENLCSLEGIYEWRLMSRFLAIEAINRRLDKLKSINSFKLAKAKQQCINSLQKSKSLVFKQLSNRP